MTHQIFTKAFNGKAKNVVIGMLHVPALPGCPKHKLPMPKIIDHVLREADVYAEQKIDSMIIENMHDVPYVKNTEMGPEITACMTAVASHLRQNFPELPLGVQMLTAANKEALAVAKAAGLNYIRGEGFVFSHVGDEGWIDSNAGPLLRYRKAIDAEDILVFTDIKKKHSSHAVTSDVSLSMTAKAAEFFLTDGVIVTGEETGSATDPTDFQSLLDAIDLPILIGSGVDDTNIHEYVGASAFIIGSHFKVNGCWSNPVCPERVKNFMSKLESY